MEAFGITDFMPLSDHRWDAVRVVEGLRGRVAMRLELIVRFDYGCVVPWVRKVDGVLLITAGPDTLELAGSVPVQGEGMKTVAAFTVDAGRTASRSPSTTGPRIWTPWPRRTAAEELERTEALWKRWSGRCKLKGRWDEAVMRSLITLKALIIGPPAESSRRRRPRCPEMPGGVRNWDYRYCWLRDATFTLNALLHRRLRAGGHGVAGMAVARGGGVAERICRSSMESPAYAASTNTRSIGCRATRARRRCAIGNAASRQFQLDVFGEVMDTLHLARLSGLDPEPAAWNLQVALLEFLESRWAASRRRDLGGARTAAALHPFENHGLGGLRPRHQGCGARRSRGSARALARGCAMQIHAEICERGFDAGRNTFVQSYESSHLDASLLLIPQVGFLPPDDPRVLGTIAAIEQELIIDGLVLRYSTETAVDALPAGEGAFLPCSFWLADCYALTGRRAQAEALFERLLSLRNDVGLLAEEYDPRTGRMLGNFPQALTHMALVNTARLLSMPAHEAQSAAAQGERPTSAGTQAAAAGDHETAADDAMEPKRAKMLTERSPEPSWKPSDLKSN